MNRSNLKKLVFALIFFTINIGSFSDETGIQIKIHTIKDFNQLQIPQIPQIPQTQLQTHDIKLRPDNLLKIQESLDMINNKLDRIEKNNEEYRKKINNELNSINKTLEQIKAEYEVGGIKSE